MESNFFHHMVWFVKPFFFLWLRVEDTLIELYLAGNNRRPSYSAEDNQMLSANGICPVIMFISFLHSEFLGMNLTLTVSNLWR